MLRLREHVTGWLFIHDLVAEKIELRLDFCVLCSRTAALPERSAIVKAAVRRRRFRQPA